MATLDRDIQATARLPAAWRNLLLTVHVLATVGVFGADLVLLVLGTSSRSPRILRLRRRSA